MKKGQLFAIRRMIPTVECPPGCVQCCCPVPFSGPEWARVPEELKKGLDVRRTESAFGKPFAIPFKPGFLPESFGPFIPHGNIGPAIRGGALDETPGSCPFVSQKPDCLIYAERPILCRLFGASMEPLLVCSEALSAKSALDKKQTQQIMQEWSKL